MTGSFALSVILFLSFSALIDFVGYLLPQSAAASDIDISSSDGANTINSRLIDTIRGMDGVKQVYGRRSSLDIPVTLDGAPTLSATIDLVSFDDFDLECLKKDDTLQRDSELSKVYGNSSYVLTTWDKTVPGKLEIKFLSERKNLKLPAC